MITVERLLKLCPDADAKIVGALAPPWDAALSAYGLTTRLQVCHCVGQFAYETAEFTKLEERLDYRAERIAEVFPKLRARAADLEHDPEALGNAAYANRYGNGDEASGDGYRYRGRGPTMVTFKSNYEILGHAAGVDLVKSPELLSDPATGIVAALAFWRYRNCNSPADRDDAAEVTRRINGGDEGLAGRQNLTNLAKAIFA